MDVFDPEIERVLERITQKTKLTRHSVIEMIVRRWVMQSRKLRAAGDADHQTDDNVRQLRGLITIAQRRA